MTKKTKIIVASILVIILIVGCIIFFPKKSDNLTLTNIHDNVVYGKTTKNDLKKLYGEPREVNTNKKKVNYIRDYWNGENGEGSVTDNLTDYRNSLQTRKGVPLRSGEYDCYIEYRGNNLGVNYVRFFFWKNTVYSIQFGNKITNKSAAKKDKYLRQIYGD